MMYSTGVSDDSSLSGCDSVFSGVYTTDGNTVLSTPGRNSTSSAAHYRARLASEDERIAQEYDLPTVIPRPPYSIDHSSSALATTDAGNGVKSSQAEKKVRKTFSVSGSPIRNSKAEPGRALTTLTDVQNLEEVVSESARARPCIPSRREESHRDDDDDVVPEPGSCVSLDVDIETDYDASEQEDYYEELTTQFSK